MSSALRGACRRPWAAGRTRSQHTAAGASIPYKRNVGPRFRRSPTSWRKSCGKPA